LRDGVWNDPTIAQNIFYALTALIFPVTLKKIESWGSRYFFFALAVAFFFGAAFFTTFFAVAMTASFQIVTHYCYIIRSFADRLSSLYIFSK